MRGTRKQKRSLRSPILKTIETTLSASVFSSSRICLAPHICKSLSNHHPVVSDGQSIIPNSQGMGQSTDPGTKHGQNRVRKIETQPPPPCRNTTQETKNKSDRTPRTSPNHPHPSSCATAAPLYLHLQMWVCAKPHSLRGTLLEAFPVGQGSTCRRRHAAKTTNTFPSQHHFVLPEFHSSLTSGSYTHTHTHPPPCLPAPHDCPRRNMFPCKRATAPIVSRLKR